MFHIKMNVTGKLKSQPELDNHEVSHHLASVVANGGSRR